MYKYFPHTPEDIAGMLAKVGAESLEDLYAELPREVLYKGDYDLPSAMSEVEVRRFFDRLGRKNRQLVCFAGAGIYDHYAPSAIPQLIERSEFLTSYTPYQAEISQGTLHYIFEYQSMMAELTGMDISNASMYDGATVLYSSSLDPKTVDVMRTYAHFHGVRLEEFNSLTTSAEDLKARVDKGDIAGVIVQQPDYYGIIEDFTGYADACHSKKALFVVNSIAADLALLKTPGEWGADLAVGDVQSLGVPMSFGGPTAGYMCSTEKLMRKLPGRIVGKTHDGNGQRVFVLTLQAREQHIRRQKATSNICSNESLMALYVTIYMSLMGKEGLKEAATISYDGAHYLCDKLIATGKARLVYDKPFFNEFLVDIDGRDEFYDRAVEKGFVPGVKVGRSGLLIAVTEQRTKDEADELAALL